jgi:peptidoglycan hydrolase-like protein with peptidoglycan-binding domain
MGSAASGQDIKQVQEALKNQGHDPGPIDGVMGPKTRQALRAFQQAKNLKATGQLDSETTSALGVSATGSSPSGMGGSSGMGSSGTSGPSSGTRPGTPDSKSGSSATTGADKTGKSGSDR